MEQRKNDRWKVFIESIERTGQGRKVNNQANKIKSIKLQK